jgi:hypothetical protein
VSVPDRMSSPKPECQPRRSVVTDVGRCEIRDHHGPMTTPMVPRRPDGSGSKKT